MMQMCSMGCIIGEECWTSGFTVFIVSKNEPALCAEEGVTLSFKVICYKDNSKR